MGFPVAAVGLGLNAIGLGSSLIGQSNANKEAVRARWAQEDEIRRRQALMEELAPIYQAMMADAMEPISLSENGPWSESYIAREYDAARTDAMRGADRAVDLVRRDLGRRNISTNSDPLKYASTNIRRGMEESLGRTMSGLRTNAAQQRAEAERQARADRFTRLSALLPMYLNTGSGVSSDIGGLATVMANDAAAARQGTTNAVQQIAGSGILNRRDGGRNQGDNRSSTNHSGIAPYSLGTNLGSQLGSNLNLALKPQPTLSTQLNMTNRFLEPVPEYNVALIR